MLSKSYNAAEQKIPLIMFQPESGKMTLEWVKLRWDNMVSSEVRNDSLEFQFDRPREDILFHSFCSQMWISALASGMAWQEPWLAAKWTVSDVPPGDVSGNGAALGIALIATASRVVYPQKTVVLGRLNPDGSLGLVSRLAECVEAAAAGGMERVIIPNMQTFESNAQGEVVDIPALAEKRGMKCIQVDHLIEATEALLDRRMPQVVVSHRSPRYDSRFTALLAPRVRALSDQISKAERDWPRTPVLWKALSSPEQSLWLDVFQNQEMGMDAYRAGQMYTAHKLLGRAWADQSALVELAQVGKNLDHPALESRANKLRAKWMERLNQSAQDKNELQSALVLAEEFDWLKGLNARVQGAQIMAWQVLDSRSDATPALGQLARMRLFLAVKSGEVQMEGPDFYSQCYAVVAQKGEVPVYNRAESLWPQLLPAQLGYAEYFVLALKARANEVAGGLLYDARLASFVRGLKESKADWEKQQEEKARVISDAAQKDVPDKIGFVPGGGYVAPRAPVPPAAVSKLSSAARCLIWVNDYCELAMLQQKYMHLEGEFDGQAYVWKVKNRVALENMLQLADRGARRGIALARHVGADVSVLNMIYEAGSNLRASEDNIVRLEALRHYWRCALLGGMCWQLSYSPSATPILQVVVPSDPPPAAPTTPEKAGPVSDSSAAPVVVPTQP
jgi:hypothetical protein